MEDLNVGRVIISAQGESSENFETFNDIVKENKIQVIVAKKGDRIQIENDLYVDVLWPNASKLISENVLNNNSIVCKLHYKSFSMLFTGDIEEIAERQILAEYRNNMQILDSTILKVGHHGSKTSSTQEFVNIVKPKIALIGVGKNNKFGHPNMEILERLKNSGSKIYRTDKFGEISVIVDSKGRIKIEKFVQ
jgi:competence protein ComEC